MFLASSVQTAMMLSNKPLWTETAPTTDFPAHSQSIALQMGNCVLSGGLLFCINGCYMPKLLKVWLKQSRFLI